MTHRITKKTAEHKGIESMKFYKMVLGTALFAALLISPILTRSTCAAVPDPIALFMKGENLFGATTQSIQSAFGDPQLTEQISLSRLGPNVTNWQYIGEKNRLELVFSNKHLVLETLSTDRSDPRNRDVFNLCQKSSLKIVYIKQMAEQSARTGPTGAFIFSMSGKTKNGHLLWAPAIVSGTNPLLYKSVLNPDTGLYVDTFTPNPSFSIKSDPCKYLTLSEGNGAPYERHQWTQAEATRQKELDRNNPNLTTYLSPYLSGYETRPIGTTPMTLANSPWLFQP